MSLTAGSRLGPYEIVATLGAGGMGEVYRALDPRLGREVALKVLPEAFARDRERLARFEREARTVAGFSHPNIVTLFSIEEDAGVRFLTMELVEGHTLDRLVATGGLPLARVLDLAIPLAEALVAAHARGVVHRDLKPANVMVTREGRVKVLDFGLAKPAADRPAPGGSQAPTQVSPVSSAGAVLGTVPYMAPEQVRGGAVDARADLFALGVMIYELAAGRRPFTGETSADISSAILRDTPAPLTRLRADLPADLDRIVGRCLAKAPGERFTAALELCEELRRLQRAQERGGDGAPARPATRQPSIAVLPFSNMSADPDNEFFSDGLSEELLNVLAKIPELKVTGRTSSFAFKGRNEDLREIGHKLGVGTLLEGSVRRAGNRVRITAQLIKAEDGFHLWSETYDRVLDDIFAVQDEIARAVSSALHVTLLGRPAAEKGNVECYSLILEANHFVLEATGPALARAVLLYKTAIEKCPDDARAWAGVARAHAYQAFYGHADLTESHRSARQAAERALALDDGNADAHDVMGMILFSLEFRLREGLEEVRRARALAPGASGPMITLANYEACFGHFDEALRLARQAREIDPLNPQVHLHGARIQGSANQLEAASATYAKATELSPGMASVHAVFGLILLERGMSDEALAEIAKETSTGYREFALGIAYHALGKRRESDEALARLLAQGEAWGYQIAAVHAARGEVDESFRWLERGYELHDSGVVLARSAPVFATLHLDPRWPRFLAKLGLPAH